MSDSGPHDPLVYILLSECVYSVYRYPDVLQRPHIPSTVFTREQAEQACEIARRILNLVEEEYIS